jgi:hypothetical protein
VSTACTWRAIISASSVGSAHADARLAVGDRRRQRERLRHGGHRAMERRIETRDLRQLRRIVIPACFAFQFYR